MSGLRRFLCVTQEQHMGTKQLLLLSFNKLKLKRLLLRYDEKQYEDIKEKEKTTKHGLNKQRPVTEMKYKNKTVFLRPISKKRTTPEILPVCLVP